MHLWNRISEPVFLFFSERAGGGVQRIGGRFKGSPPVLCRKKVFKSIFNIKKKS